MSLEGNVRDLALQEVLQLLAHGRKSGQLHVNAQLAGLAAVVTFNRGAIVDACIGAATLTAIAADESARTAKQVESAALELITWCDGTFAFVPMTADSVRDTGVRLATEMVLVEGARQMDGWAQLADRIPHARAVPAFVNVEPRHLPLLHLVPQQWEVLTRVDGQRNLPALAEALGRDVLEVAEIVHGLIGTGLLMLVEASRPVRTQATPPAATAVVSPPHESGDFWVPAEPESATRTEPALDDPYDAIFDPVRVGVITPEGLPRLRTPMHQPAIHSDAPRMPQAPRRTVTIIDETDDISELIDYRALGDAAARRGEFTEALTHWSAYLRTDEHGPDADHVREAIAVAARMHALLYAGASANTRP